MPRTIRKEIKRPDAFQTYGQRAYIWLAAHRAKFFAAAGAVLAAALIVAGYRLWTARAQRQAALSYAMATRAAPEGKGPAVEAALRKTAEDYGRVRGGVLARLRLAELLRDRGEPKAAEEEYRRLLASRAANPADRELARRGLADALAAQGRCDEALPIWKEILAQGSLFTSEDIYLAIGACHESRGRFAEAKKTYEELSQKFPASPFLTERLRARMGILGKKR